jgi:RHS repeat-associated protein
MANGSPLLVLSYARDAIGRITVVTESSAGAERTTEYRYDPAGRLAEVLVDGATVERNTYDAVGNRLSVTRPDSSVFAQYDVRDRLRVWGDLTYEYEPDGTLTHRAEGNATVNFDIDELGALRAVDLPDGRRIDYVLDGLGWRIGRMVEGQLVAGYLYRPNGQLVAELDGTGQVVGRFAYDERGRLLSIERGGESFLVITDHLGSPRLVIDAVSGETAQEIEYDAWGQVTLDSNPGFQPFGLAGGLRDLDTGLVHFGARDYDPTIGRWIEADPVRFASDDANLYAYVGSDPVNRADPTGLGKVHKPFCYLAAWCGPWPDDPSGNWYCLGLLCAPPSPGATPKPGLFCVGYCGSGPGGFVCVGNCFQPGTGSTCVFYCSSGDPHIRTADRLGVSFQGAGEYLMAHAADGSVVIQARQEPPFDLTQVTITTALAAWVSGDRVGVYLAEDGALSLRVNGQLTEGTDVSRALPQGGSITRLGPSIVVDWPDGSRLTVDQRGNHLDYDFVPDPAIAPTLTGLMGTADGDVGNDLVSRDGLLTLSPDAPDFFTQLHGPFGDSWRIAQAESLFDYSPGESTATFTRPDIPTAPATTEAVDPAARATAEALCRAVGATNEPTLSDCIVDVGFTGDSSYAASAAAVQAATAGAPPAPGVARPISIGDTVAGTILAAEQIDTYAFVGAAGDAVYLDALGPCVGDLAWDLLGPAGAHLFSGLICNDLGPWTIQTDGSYTIEVYSDEAATGFYGFQLRANP